MLLLLLITGCTPVRPVIKIGLIAPFEGLYRQSGYAALAAMRQALNECTPPGIDLLPLALDDSGDPIQAQRAAQKLLVDPTVHAIIGPLLLDSIAAVAAVLEEPQVETDLAGERESSAPAWLIPLLIFPTGGFAPTASDEWLQAQTNFIATTTSATRILLVGLSTQSPWKIDTATSLGQSETRPMLRIDDLDAALDTVQADDAVLWLGRPDTGAHWLTSLRAKQPNVDFWLVDQAGIDVFTAQAEALHATHLLVWTDVEYNRGSRSATQATETTDFMRYRIYRATCAALDGLQENVADKSAAWELQERPLER